MGNFAVVEIDGVTVADGRLAVINPPPLAPAGSTSISQPASPEVNVSGNSTQTDTYVITNTKVLTLQQLNAGAEDFRKESKIKLWYAPDGIINVNAVLKALVYVGGSSNPQVDFNEDFTGNGIAAIILERIRLDGGSREIFGRWAGYET